MKSLLYLLFLGAVVATLAEEPFEDEAVAELLDEEDDETIAELADEENDPRRRPKPSGRPPRPSGRPSKKMCRRVIKRCLRRPTHTPRSRRPRPTKSIGRLCKKLLKYCLKHRPSRRPGA
ncbi:hypothetical protein ABFA07_001908 [Porites harrisoni]